MGKGQMGEGEDGMLADGMGNEHAERRDTGMNNEKRHKIQFQFRICGLYGKDISEQHVFFCCCRPATISNAVSGTTAGKKCAAHKVTACRPLLGSIAISMAHAIDDAHAIA